MGFIELILGVVFTALIGAAISVTTSASSASEFMWARVLFITAAIAVAAAYWYWIYDSHLSLREIIVGLIAGCLVFPGSAGLLEWVNKRERTLTGSESFAYVTPQPTKPDGNVPLAIRSVGENPLTGVKLTIRDLADFPFGEPQVIDVGVLAADSIRLLEGVHLKAPTKPGEHSYWIEISAQNGIFDEQIGFRTQLVNSLGCVSDSLRVSKRRTVSESKRNPTPQEIKKLMLIDQGWHSFIPCEAAKK